jgi:restriction system protein
MMTVQANLRGLAVLGGSASNEELEDALISTLNLTQEQLDVSYPKSGAPVVPDRMSWARSYLKVPGLIANPKRGVWVLTEEGRTALTKSNAELKQTVTSAIRASEANKKAAQASTEDLSKQESGENVAGWSD